MSEMDTNETSPLSKEFVDLMDEFMGEQIISFTAWQEIIACETEEAARKIFEAQFDSPEHAKEAEAYLTNYIRGCNAVLADENALKMKKLHPSMTDLLVKMTELGSKRMIQYLAELRESPSMTIKQVRERCKEDLARFEAANITEVAVQVYRTAVYEAMSKYKGELTQEQKAAFRAELEALEVKFHETLNGSLEIA